MKLLIKSLIDQGQSPNDILYVTLDDYMLRQTSITDIDRTFCKVHKHPIDRPLILFLDEVTSIKDYSIQLKNLVDQGHRSIVASSSSASFLKSQRGRLTGRAEYIEIQPLDFDEFLSFRNVKILKKNRHLLDEYFRDYIRCGGLPEHVLYPDRDYLMTLVDDIIQKDITAFYNLKDPQLMRDMFILLMERSGKQVSINKLANILSLSPDTARRYLNYFIDSFLVHAISRWGKTNERLLSPKKLYAGDLGIKYLFMGERDLGSYFENYVYLKLRRKQPVFYIKSEGYEIDFFTQDKTLIEVKYNMELHGEQKSLFDRYPARQKIFIQSIEEARGLDGL